MSKILVTAQGPGRMFVCSEAVMFANELSNFWKKSMSGSGLLVGISSVLSEQTSYSEKLVKARRNREPQDYIEELLKLIWRPWMT